MGGSGQDNTTSHFEKNEVFNSFYMVGISSTTAKNVIDVSETLTGI